MGVFAGQSRRRVEVPAELAVLHFEIGRERDEKPVGHGIDEGRTFFDRLRLLAHDLIESLRWQRLEPVGQTEHSGDRLGNDRFEPRWAAKGQGQLIRLVH